MKKNKFDKHKPCGKFAGFTLVEMLAVILIIGILVAILIPVLANLKTKSKANLARLDCSTIAQAITQYNMDNIGRFPIRRGQTPNSSGDITFSYHNNPQEKFYKKGKPDPAWQTGQGPHNSDIMIILSALESIGTNDVNEGHTRNSKKFDYLGATLINSNVTAGMRAVDGIFQDPFGNPYVVTIDKNADGKCFDKLYGALGHVQKGKAMVWSAGPDLEIDPNAGAKAGKNSDNITGW